MLQKKIVIVSKIRPQSRSLPSIEKLTGPMCPSVVPRINGVEGPVTSDQRKIRNGAVESDDCEKMNASSFDAMESAAKSVLLGFVDLRLAFVFPRDETKSERDGAFTVHQ